MEMSCIKYLFQVSRRFVYKMNVKRKSLFVVISVALIYPFLSTFIFGEPSLEFLLIDSQERRVGYDTITGEIVNEIPESSYGDEYLPDLYEENVSVTKNLDVTTPFEGKYTLYIIGKDTGTYDIEIEPNDKDANYTIKIISVTIRYPNEIKRVFIDYTPEVGEVSQIFEDNTPPVTRLTISQPKFDAFNTTYISPNTTLGLEATDPVVGEGSSGVKYIEYRIDGSSWITHTSTFSITTEGKHFIEYHSVDYVGNVEEVESSVVFVTIIPDYVLIGIDKASLSGKIEIEGNLRSNNDVGLKGYVRVDGDVYGKEVYISKKSTVTGM